MNRRGPSVASVALSHSPQMAQDVEARSGTEFRRGLGRLVQAVTAYDPTLVVFFGPDHLRALVGIAPCFTVVESATGYGDWGTPAQNYDVPRDVMMNLASSLIASGIDIGMAGHLKLDHGFGQSTHDLFGSLSAVRLIPIVVNCVGRPLATIERTAALGSAVGEFLRRELDASERVLVVGSGGLSHEPPSLIEGARDLTEVQRQRLITESLESAAEAVNPEWDRNFLSRLGSPEWRELAGMTADDLAPSGAGGAEVRNWIASAFAGGEPLRTVVYQPMPEWITGMGIAASPQLLDAAAPES